MSDVIGGPHPCLFSGCTVTVPEGRLVCDKDWLRVPLALRQAMVDAFERFGDLSPFYRNAVQAVVDWLTLESWRAARLSEGQR